MASNLHGDLMLECKFSCAFLVFYGQKSINNITDFDNRRLKKILIPYYLILILFGIIEFIFARDVFVQQ